MNEKCRTDRKATRRKTKNKIQTLVKKAVEISEHDCDILLIVHYKETRHWIQYCTSVAESLFFGFQTAKKDLEIAEEFNNTNYERFSSSLGVVDGSVSPRPAKLLKTRDAFSDTQTIKSAGFGKLEEKSEQGAVSTGFTSTVSPSVFLPTTVKKPPDIQPSPFIFEAKTKEVEESSSPDFDFETYFSAASQT